MIAVLCLPSYCWHGNCCMNEFSIVSTRIWNSPYQNQIRLSKGAYTNQGLVEVYCNGQWGTVCDDLFGQTEANTVCKQLGYTGAAQYDNLTPWVVYSTVILLLYDWLQLMLFYVGYYTVAAVLVSQSGWMMLTVFLHNLAYSPVRHVLHMSTPTVFTLKTSLLYVVG